MKARSTLLALGLGISTLAVAAAPSVGAKGGTDILHISLRMDLMANADADAEGQLAGMLRQQGNADVQKLRMDVSGLAPEANYYLLVWLRDALAPTEIMTFATDEDGEASLKLMHLGNGKKSFPVGLDTLSDVVGMEVRDEADAIALDADLTNPTSLQYLVKRRLTNDGVDEDAEGTLFMKEHGSKTLFRLVAANLDPNADYTLTINGMDFGPFTADADGRLAIDSLPDGAPLPFDMTSVELIDGADMSVLSTDLPSELP